MTDMVGLPLTSMTPVLARKALLNGVIRARIGTKASPIGNVDIQNIVALLQQMELEATALQARAELAEYKLAKLLRHASNGSPHCVNLPTVRAVLAEKEVGRG